MAHSTTIDARALATLKNDNVILKPPPETLASLAAATAEALEAVRTAGAGMSQLERAVNSSKKEDKFIRYIPDEAAPGYNPKCAERIVRIAEKQIDPLEPAKFRARRAPHAIVEEPVSIQREPAKKITPEDQAMWKLPPCVSNWKNQQGYTIPLDMRLQADGRGLQEITVNSNFAQFAESLYVADRFAREEITLKNDLERQKKQMEEAQREEKLRDIAAKARAERNQIFNELRQSTVPAQPSVKPEKSSDQKKYSDSSDEGEIRESKRRQGSPSSSSSSDANVSVTREQRRDGSPLMRKRPPSGYPPKRDDERPFRNDRRDLRDIRPPPPHQGGHRREKSPQFQRERRDCSCSSSEELRHRVEDRNSFQRSRHESSPHRSNPRHALGEESRRKPPASSRSPSPVRQARVRRSSDSDSPSIRRTSRRSPSPQRHRPISRSPPRNRPISRSPTRKRHLSPSPRRKRPLSPSPQRRGPISNSPRRNRQFSPTRLDGSPFRRHESGHDKHYQRDQGASYSRQPRPESFANQHHKGGSPLPQRRFDRAERGRSPVSRGQGRQRSPPRNKPWRDHSSEGSVSSGRKVHERRDFSPSPDKFASKYNERRSQRRSSFDRREPFLSRREEPHRRREEFPMRRERTRRSDEEESPNSRRFDSHRRPPPSPPMDRSGRRKRRHSSSSSESRSTSPNRKQHQRRSSSEEKRRMAKAERLARIEAMERERRREIRRELRLEVRAIHLSEVYIPFQRAGKKRFRSEEDRDVSEKIALGQAVATTQEGLYDARLFNRDTFAGPDIVSSSEFLSVRN